jgi:hypothetical protein
MAGYRDSPNRRSVVQSAVPYRRCSRDDEDGLCAYAKRNMDRIRCRGGDGDCVRRCGRSAATRSILLLIAPRKYRKWVPLALPRADGDDAIEPIVLD